MEKLKLDWATHEAAKYACEYWHYSKRIPVNKLVKIGIWEDDIFKGVIIFGMGASATAHIQYNLKSEQVCELVRVAMRDHETPITKLIKIAIKMLIKENKGIELITSFSDPYQGHYGIIYQAGNWIFAGYSAKVKEYFYNEKWRHATDVYKRLSSDAIKKLKVREKPEKMKYLYPISERMKKYCEEIKQPYIKREKHKSNVDGVQLSEGGAVPTFPLQN
jgi:hypothetical protein